MERSQFESLALEHLDAVYRLALTLTKNPGDAEDLVQETYLRALGSSSAERFEDRGGGMRAWLFTIAHHAFYSRLRKDRRRPAAAGDAIDHAPDARTPDEAPPAWDLASLDWEHVDGRLKKAIHDLRDDYRQVLLLWGVQGLKYREIAEMLDIPIGTVMSRLHRARKILADALEGDPLTVGLRPAPPAAASELPGATDDA